MDNADNQGLEVELVENSDDDEVEKEIQPTSSEKMEINTQESSSNTLLNIDELLEKATELEKILNRIGPSEELRPSSPDDFGKLCALIAYDDMQKGRSSSRLKDIINGFDQNPKWLPTGKRENFHRIRDKSFLTPGAQAKALGTPGVNGSYPSASTSSGYGSYSSGSGTTVSGSKTDVEADKVANLEGTDLDSWGLPKLTEKEMQSMLICRRIKERGLWEVDPRNLFPVNPKETHYFIDYFLKEQKHIAKEQKILVRWQRKVNRRYSMEAEKAALSKLMPKKDSMKEQEEMAKKISGQISSMISSFWDKQRLLFQEYENRLLDEAKKKKREDELMSVIDRSSTLTKLMIPGHNVEENLNDSLELNEDLDDMESFIKSLPKEYLEEYMARGRINDETEETNENISSETTEEEDEQDEKESEVPQKRRSSRLTTSNSTESKSNQSINSKDSTKIENGKNNKRNSLGSHDVQSPRQNSPVKTPPIVNGEMKKVENGQKSAESVNDKGDEVEEVSSQRQPKPANIADSEMNDLAKMASSFQPTGNTYETAKVKTNVPTILDAKLREYQHIGLDWLASLFNNKLNGILADEMGLGKTVQTIAFLAYLAEEKKIWGPHLIVVPTSVLLNWEREFKRFCPSLKVLTYFGSTKERSEKRKGWKKPNSFNICITTYDLYIRDTRMFKWRAWQTLVLDEAHNIKNTKSVRWNKLLSLRTRIRLLLTGTPLQNNLMELWSLLYFLMPSVFASQDDFKNWFNDPMNAMIEGSVEYNSKIIEKLHTVLRPFILRRLKSEVEKQMPLKLERVVYCPLSRLQRNLYNAFLRQRTTIDSIRGGSAVSVMNIVMQLRKCCNHPNLFIPITCKGPMKLPTLSINFPLNVKEPENLKVQPILEIMKNDFIDLDDKLATKNSKKCITVAKKKETFKIPGLSFIKPKQASYLKLAIEDIPESTDKATEKMRWLWNVTKEIRDSLKPNEQQKSMIFDPAERILDLKKERLVHRYSFAPFEVFSERPYSNLADSFTQEEEDLYDEAVRTEDELASYCHYGSLVEIHDPRLVEIDCGKLRMLSKLLRQLKLKGHRCLIFTQMSKMLDILEIFLTHQKHMYFRLDGSTPIQQRQVMMDRFNVDERIFVFILSTRSGGIGMNLTGADTVIFYDSDWNPTMDAQAQDRCHRIGQTRNVVIYRLISASTIEENILKRAFHKRKLGEMTLDDAGFTPNFMEKSNVRELFQGEEALEDVLKECDFNVNAKDLEKVLSKVEDPNDVQAAEQLKKEIGQDNVLLEDEFEEMIQNELSAVERWCFNWYRNEHRDIIEQKLKDYEDVQQTENRANNTSDIEMESEEEEENDEEVTKTVNVTKSSSRKRPGKTAVSGPQQKRVKFTGVKTRSK